MQSNKTCTEEKMGLVWIQYMVGIYPSLVMPFKITITSFLSFHVSYDFHQTHTIAFFKKGSHTHGLQTGVILT